MRGFQRWGDELELLEEDDDDGTGMSPFPFAVNTTQSSTVAGLRVPATGTYFLRVTAKDPTASMAYRLLMIVTPLALESEIEPNDTPAQAIQPLMSPTIRGTLTAGDVDCYRATVLDYGVPLVMADGWPETVLFPVDLAMILHLNGGQVVVNSSQLSARPGEAIMVLTENGMHVCLAGRSATPGIPTYHVGLFYSSQGPLPVDLTSFEVH